MGDVLRGIAHNWRQPLNVLGIVIQDAKMAYSDNEMTEEYINEMVKDSMRQINQMSKMIDNFRSFTNTNEEQSFFDASKPVQDTMELMKSQIDELGINFTMQVQNDDKLSMKTYQNTLKQALYNIVSNALDAISKRRENGEDFEPKIVVTISKKDDNNVEIAVFNNGGNIPDDVMERLFEPYFTTKEQGKGVGLGLYMSRMEIEEQMEGTLTARNKDDGVELCITIPL
jgi:signal transduction histidine kinase